MLSEILSWHLTPTGKQRLTIFQTDNPEKEPITCLDSALALISEHQRLLDETDPGLTENRQGVPLESALSENRTGLRNE